MKKARRNYITHNEIMQGGTLQSLASHQMNTGFGKIPENIKG